MDLSTLEVTVVSELQRAKAPGCSIAVTDAKHLLDARGFGLADLRSVREATADTRYHLMSVTKLFTTVALLQLVERGELKLDDEVSKVLPDVPVGITYAHLLSHRSGLVDTLKAFLSVHFDPKMRPSVTQALVPYRLVAKKPPGKWVAYRNINFMLVGRVIEVVSEMAYGEYLAQNVLQPLELDVSLSALTQPEDSLATGYFARWDLMGFLLKLAIPDTIVNLRRERIGRHFELAPYDLDCLPIGGLVASMPDLAKFAADQLSEESLVLKRDSRDRMQELVAHGKAGIVSREGVGLGWKVGKSPVHGRFLNHEGGGPGFTTEIRIYPDHQIGIAMAMNRFSTSASRSIHRICEEIVVQRER